MHTPSNLRSSNFWLSCLAVVLVLAFALWQWRNLEWVPEHYNAGWSREALQNPLLAAEYLLAAHYPLVASRSFQGLEQLQVRGEALGANHTLILTGTFHALNPQEVEALWSWVAQGGHLIAVVHNPNIPPLSTQQDALLARLGLTFHQTMASEHPAQQVLEWSPEYEPPSERDAAEAEAEQYSKVGQGKYLCEQTTTDIALPGTPPVAVALDAGHYFERLQPELTAQALLTHINQQLALLRQPVGAGRVTLLNHAAPLSNRRIACADHAFALMHLVGDTQQVWLLHNRAGPSLITALWQQLPAVLIALVLALLLWLWGSARRFGPVHRVHRAGRRNFMAHIEASAHFLWRRGRPESLCKTLRQGIFNQLNQRQPGFHRLNRDEQIRQIAQQCQLPEPEVEQALFGEIPPKTGAFITLIQLLQDIRNRL